MNQTKEPIAVIGSACRFPGGSNSPSKLWELLQNPRDVLCKVPANRYDSKAYYHPDPLHHGTSNVQESYFLDEDPAMFDNSFFNIQSSEAEAIDPQQRMLLETVYDSLCDAGLTVEGLRGSSTSVFVGLMCDDWSGLLTRDWDALPTYASTGMGRSIMSNRISYFFDWRGPGMTIDTACSSSLIAVHQAMQTILSGESRVALAAGSNLILSPAMYIAESKLRMLSPDSRCRMWDEGANGYGRGEGVAAVLLKRLSDALEDGDKIECIIRASAVNQDGKTTGLTMPSSSAQADLIRQTYARAGLDINDPNDRPQFFQAHGTGTGAGDPREAEAIAQAFFERGNPCPDNKKLLVGSVKTVIGHTEGTAGLASLISAIQALKNGIVPPNMHFNQLSHEVAPFYKHLEIPTVAKAWPKVGNVRRVSVNSFGFGGTNCHVIVESFTRPEKATSTLDGPQITPFVFSAASEESLRLSLRRHLDFLRLNVDINLRDFAWILQNRRSTLPYRKAVAASSHEDLIGKIAILLDEENADGNALDTRFFNKPKARILGVFTGQGAQWSRMSARLIEQSPLVTGYIAQLDQSLMELPASDRPAWTIKDELFASGGRLDEAEIAQPLCTAVQIILVNLLRLAGVNFHSVIGHSSGEIAAAYASGLISAQDAIRIAYYRGRCARLAKSPRGNKGAMAAIGTTLDDALSFCALEIFEGKLQVAAHNSPSSVTLSGDVEAIEEAVEIFHDEQKLARKLKVDTAYHSNHMQPCAQPYLDSLKSQHCDTTQIPGHGPVWYSSVHQGQLMTKDNLNAQYWVDNMTMPVLFSSTVTHVVGETGPFDLALEIGPHPALKGPCLSSLEEVSKNIVPYFGLLARGKDDLEEFSSTLGEIWTNFGIGSVKFDDLDQEFSGNLLSKQMLSGLPLYPFNHSRSFWSMSRASSVQINNHSVPHPLLGRRCIESETTHEISWRNVLRPKEISWLHGHGLQGQIVFPATAYVAMGVDAIVLLAKKHPSLIKIEDLVIGRAIAFHDENSSIESLFTAKIIRSNEIEIVAEFACYSSSSNETAMSRNAYGRIVAQFDGSPEEMFPPLPAETFNLVDIEVDRFYSSLSRLGYDYNAPFKSIREIKRKHGYSTGTVEDQSGSAWEDQMVVHPGMMDSVLQTISVAFCCPGDGRLSTIHVPTGIKSWTINPRYTSLGLGKQRALLYQSVVRESYRGETVADVHLFSEDGSKTFMQVEGVQLKTFSPPSAKDDVMMFSHFDYRIANPDGKLALGIDQKPTPLEIETATDLERISFFYLRNLLQNISPEENANTLPHFQKLLNWAAHVDAFVERGEHLTVLAEYKSDTKELIEELIAKHPDRVDVRLVQAVGENLPTVIRENSSILEHMTKDGVLDDFYGIETANDWLAQMAGQLAYRYPGMHILEIGAGTGGSTRVVLPVLDSSFSSYTYTDISSAFFEAAEDRFSRYADRMAFKTFSMEEPPISQGFVEGSYDLVIAANVLHITNKLEDMMTNVRQLLKPGGYLMVFEVISNDALRIGLSMGGLPGWWVGADNGRPWGPTLTLPQWDSLLRRCGFAGIETSTPPYHELHPGAVFAAQAVDDRVNLLREPLSAPQETSFSGSETLTIVGGKTTPIHELVEQIVTLFGSKWKQVNCFMSIEEFNTKSITEGSSVLCLTELDEPLFRVSTPAKLDALKVIWGGARNILWLTRRSRSEEPHSNMVVGLGRAMRAEYPNINLQMLDVDEIDENTARVVAESFLRLELLDLWAKRKSGGNLMWSAEPELALMENGHTFIPRLLPRNEANLRYNSSRRLVTKEVDPRKTNIQLKGSGDSISLQEITPLRVDSHPWPTTTIQVSHSVFPFIHVKDVGYTMLLAGTDMSTNQPVFALALSAENPAPTLSSWTIPRSQIEQGQSGVGPETVLLSIAASLIAEELFSLVPSAGALLVHDPDPVLEQVLLRYADSKEVQLFLATTSRKSRSKRVTYIHPNLSQRLIKRILPNNIAAFIHLGENSVSRKVSKIIANCLPQNCVTAGADCFFTKKTEPLHEPFVSGGQRVLQTACEKAANMNLLLDDNKCSIPLSQLTTHFQAHQESLSVVDWTVPSVSVEVQAIDAGTIFGSNKTYVLVGLAGELGQSIIRWMVERGARHLVLASRRPKVHPEFIDSLANQNTLLKILPCDVSNRTSLHACFSEIRRTMPPIAGVANGAMILRDSMFQNMTFDDFMTCLRPKVDGTILLDEMFYDSPLEFFIVFSSLTAVVGNSGQSNYAAANMFMAALAAQRKKRGVAGSAIDISSLMGIGYVERSEKLDADYFTRLGYTNISEVDLHQLFAEAIAAGRPESDEISEIVTGVAPFFSDQEIKPHFYTDPKFAHFVLEHPGTTTQASKTTSVPIRIRLIDIENPDQAQDLIKECFIARLKRIFQMPPEEKLSDNVSLVELGLDSLMAVDVRKWFLNELEIDMPTLKIIGGGTVNGLVDDTMQRLPKYQKELEESEPTDATVSSSTEASSTLSDSLSDSVSSSGSVSDLSAETTSNAPSAREITVRSSYGQARYWFMQQSMKDAKIGNMAVMFQLVGPLRIDDFERALQVVALRHEALRTRIIPQDNGEAPMQGILSSSLIRLDRKRIDSQKQAYEELQLLYDHEWDLNNWEGLKVSLLTLKDTDHYVVFGAHHILLDATSFNVLFVELEAIYSGKSLSPLTVASQYRSFAAQERRDYKSGRMRESIEYYRKEIPQHAINPLPLLPFAKIHTRHPVIRWNMHKAPAHLDASTSGRIKQLARKCRSTPFHVYMGVLQTLLFRLLPDMEGFCIGILNENRQDQKFMDTMGLFVNSLPLHFSRNPQGTKFSETVQAARNKVYAALEHSQLPFDILLNALNVPRSTNHAPLYQVCINYRTILRERATFGECNLGEERWYTARGGNDLNLEIWDNVDGETNLIMKLNDTLYSQESADTLLKSYLKLLEEFSRDPDMLCEAPTL